MLANSGQKLVKVWLPLVIEGGRLFVFPREKRPLGSVLQSECRIVGNDPFIAAAKTLLLSFLICRRFHECLHFRQIKQAIHIVVMPQKVGRERSSASLRYLPLEPYVRVHAEQ